MSMIYLDHAATTPVLPEVADAMQPYYRERYANPSGVYDFSVKRKKEIESVRKIIADALHAEAEEIYFTSCGTESDNWAVKAAVWSKERENFRPHIITTKIEHHAILHSCEGLEKEGAAVTYLNVDERGKISLEELKNSVRPETVLVSVMYANNEVGTIQPIKDIGYLCKEHNILFHTDAVQVFGHLPINVKDSGIDMLSASAHKFNGPKGIGFLYVKKEYPIPSFLHGGAQESGRRAGTENVAGIIGMGKAAELAQAKMAEREKRVEGMRNHMISRVLSEIPFSRLNGGRSDRLPGNCNFSFQFIRGSELLVFLDAEGICASAGSACSSGSPDPSHVLKALGLPDELAHGALRLTIGHQNTMKEIDAVVDVVKKAVSKLRETSSEYEDYQLMHCKCPKRKRHNTV